MRLKSIELTGFKSFARKTFLEFDSAITAIVGPNGSGKSNIAEAFRFVLGEQSMKSMRGRKGEDMIWNGSSAISRSNRASVRLVFDNSDRALNLDFDDVSIERVVHRDGVNDYLLNRSIVRLRDIAELLSQANIGSSGHHIISQGEADRILSASSRERREMLEDALGLTAYFYRREEAEHKLEKTADNMREVDVLRRELAPHLRFLQAQVKKIEEEGQLRGSITEQYLEYLKRESVYLRIARLEATERRGGPQQELLVLESHIAKMRSEASRESTRTVSLSGLLSLEKDQREAVTKREELMRALGRIEGEQALRDKMIKEPGGGIPSGEVKSFAQHLEKELTRSLSLQGTVAHSALSSLISFVKDFLNRITHTSSQQSSEAIGERKREVEHALRELEAQETTITKSIAALRSSIERQKDASREIERELFTAMTRRSELESTLVKLSAHEELLSREEEMFRLEYKEAGVLIGQSVAQFDSYTLHDAKGGTLSEVDIYNEDRKAQQERFRKLERLKIKLEEIATGNAEEVLKEHKETSSRDQFLVHELEDLDLSAKRLRQLISELTMTLEMRFADGIGKINKEFDAFFKLMFGGGVASLLIVKEQKVRRRISSDDNEGTDEEAVEMEEGIDISVALPHKRIKGLHMLSGGERALTSIALIFAMSQVNPPPFLILDETDAALDEANSRRYGDMIENLAQKSQLVLITHNRETMSRASILYGVTMSSDSISKLLTVRFEEAVAVAK